MPCAQSCHLPICGVSAEAEGRLVLVGGVAGGVNLSHLSDKGTILYLLRQNNVVLYY